MLVVGNGGAATPRGLPPAAEPDIALPGVIGPEPGSAGTVEPATGPEPFIPVAPVAVLPTTADGIPAEAVLADGFG